MTLRNLMKRHARTVLTSPEHHGEAATLYPSGGGTSRQVRVTIARKGRQRSDDGRITGLMAEVWIPNDAEVGITAFRAGDELEFAIMENGEAARHRLSELLGHDGAGFLVRVWA